MTAPTVGRIVYFTDACNDFIPALASHTVDGAVQPLAAVVSCVWSDSMLNLAVFDANGVSHSRTSVPLVQPGDLKPEVGYYCEWMPYQIAQEASKVAPAVSTSAPAFTPNPQSTPK